MRTSTRERPAASALAALAALGALAAFAAACAGPDPAVATPTSTSVVLPAATSSAAEAPKPGAEPRPAESSRLDAGTKPAARFTPAPDAPLAKWTLGQLTKVGKESARLACALVDRFGAGKAERGELRVGIRDGERGTELVVRLSSELWLEIASTEAAQPDETTRAAVVDALRAALEGAPAPDCEIERFSSGIYWVVGVRRGEPFVEAASFDRAFAFVVESTPARWPGTDERDRAFRRADALVALWNAAEEPERARHAAQREAVRDAARTFLRDNPMNPAWLSPIGKKGYCEAITTTAKTAGLTSRDDRALVAEARTRFCGK